MGIMLILTPFSKKYGVPSVLNDACYSLIVILEQDTQLIDKLSARRFDPKLFINCIQYILCAVDKDLWVQMSCS